MVRRIVVGIVAALAAVVAVCSLLTLELSAAYGRSRTRITVSPTIGSRETNFVIRFRAPERTGRVGSLERFYQVSATSRSGRCGESAEPPPARKGAIVRVTLRGGDWCAGTYHGTVVLIETGYCPRGEPCPPVAPPVARLKRVGAFSFAVRPPGGADTTPPVFAGLQSAVACTPGPQRPGETTPFTLTWKAATDDQTPSSQIVYDVYMSTVPGAENFSRPSWTTAPGVTTFRTPGLPSHGTFYFVVRARDRAGKEERNRVERRGLDLCL